MKRFLLGLLVLLACPLAAQVLPSSVTPLAACRVYASPGALAAGSTTFLTIRGVCNVPAEANGVFAVITASGASAAGQVRVWDATTVLPPSSGALPFEGPAAALGTYLRLCYPAAECSLVDAAARVETSSVALTIDVTGYTVPLP